MKKIIFLAITGIISATSFSQTKWGIQALAGITSGTLTSDGQSLNGKSNVAFGAGVVAEVPLSSEISFRPSLNLLKKGLRIENNYIEDDYREEFKFTTDLYYAELPLNVVYNSNAKFGRVFIGAGPSLGFGLSGKAKYRYVYQDPFTPLQVDEESADAYGSEDDDGAGLKRFEVSASVIAGVQFPNGFFVNAGGLFGLNSLISAEDDAGYRHRGFHLTVGMFFNRKK